MQSQKAANSAFPPHPITPISSSHPMVEPTIRTPQTRKKKVLREYRKQPNKQKIQYKHKNDPKKYAANLTKAIQTNLVQNKTNNGHWQGKKHDFLHITHLQTKTQTSSEKEKTETLFQGNGQNKPSKIPRNH